MDLGGLFVKLGFKVDTKDLYSFNSELKNTLNTALKLAGVTGGLAGFTSLLNGAGKSAVALDNLSLKFGVATKKAQEFASAAMAANPNMSRESGLGAYSNIAQFVADMPMRGARSLQYFGGTNADNTPEKVIERLREGFSRVESEWGRGQAVRWVEEITGTSEALNALLMTQEDYRSSAQKGVVDEESLHSLQEYSSAVQDLSIEFENLKSRWLAVPAKQIAGFLKGESGAKKQYSSIGEYIENEGIGGFLMDAFTGGSRQLLEGAQISAGVMSVGAKSILGGKGAADPMANSVLSHFGYSLPGSPADAGSIQEGAKAFFQNMGWSPAQAAGIVERLSKESFSTLDPNAVGDGGKAYGVAQWHPNRQADFEKWAGKDIRNSSREEQLSFINYELTKGNERAAGNMLKKAQTQGDAYRIFTNQYERPAAENRAPAQKVDIHVHTTADAQGTANETKRAFQQTNLGVSY